MFKCRLTYAVTLISVFIFYIVYPPWFSWYLLILVLMLMPFDLIISIAGLRTKEIKLTAPVVLEKNANGALSITVIHKKPFPIRCLKIKIDIIGDDFVERITVLCEAAETEKNNHAEILIDSSHTGLTVFEVKKLSAISLIGLFSYNIKTTSRVSVLILPLPQKPSNSIALPNHMNLRPKPGGGFSEEHDMREYRQGDPIKNIHWKLSAKLNSFIIREPLIQPRQTGLVHMIPWKNAEERDFVLSHLRWVSDYLIKIESPYYVKLGDIPLIEEVSEEQDLINYLRRVLDKNFDAKDVYILRLTRFTWTYRIDGYKDRVIDRSEKKRGEPRGYKNGYNREVSI